MMLLLQPTAASPGLSYSLLLLAPQDRVLENHGVRGMVGTAGFCLFLSVAQPSLSAIWP